MSRMLSKMNLISVVQQLPKEDIEIIQGYVEMIEDENKKYKEVIDKAIELLNNPWSFESGNKEVDEITHKKKWEIINLLKEAE